LTAAGACGDGIAAAVSSCVAEGRREGGPESACTWLLTGGAPLWPLVCRRLKAPYLQHSTLPASAAALPVSGRITKSQSSQP